MRLSSIVILAFFNVVIVPMMIFFIVRYSPLIHLPIYVGCVACWLFQLAVVETTVKVDKIIRANLALNSGR